MRAMKICTAGDDLWLELAECDADPERIKRLLQVPSEVLRVYDSTGQEFLFPVRNITSVVFKEIP